MARIQTDLKRAAGVQAGAGQGTPRLGALRHGAACGCPNCRACSRRRDSRATIRSAPAVGHLTGYVGAASAEQYKKTKDPLLVTPGFKMGKDGLEKTLESRLRGEPGAKRVEVTARGKLVRELTTRPRRARQDGQADHRRGPAGICRAAAGHQFGLGRWSSIDHRRRARDGLDARPTIPTASPTGSAISNGRCCRTTITCR